VADVERAAAIAKQAKAAHLTQGTKRYPPKAEL